MRASGASELENFHNYIHLPMQFQCKLLQTIITTSGTSKERGTTKGTTLRVIALFGYMCPSFRNLPTLCILHKTACAPL